MLGRIRSRLIARTLLASVAFALLLTVAIGVLIYAISEQRSAADESRRAQEALTAGATLEKSVVNLDNGIRAFANSGRADQLRPFTSARRAYPAQLRELRRLVSDEGPARALVNRIAVGIEDYIDLWALPLITVARSNPETARSLMGNVTGRERIDAIRDDFTRLARLERASAQNRRDRAAERADIATFAGIAAIVVVISLTLALILYVQRLLVRPILAVADASRKVGEGDLTVRVRSSRTDEVGQLVRGFNDMTASLERGQAELEKRTRELERSNRDLEDFASVASHDLQEPLVTISRFGEVLTRRLRDRDDPDAEIAENIVRGSHRLRDLVRDLLAYSRMGRGEPRRDVVELDAVVRTAMENLAGPIEEAGADVDVAPLPAVTGDERRLSQVMQNLLANAVKFSDEDHPVIRVSARVEDGECVISVADNGIGFEPDQAEQIFRAFHRLNAGERFSGSGIGLAVCERIVTQHGGRIWAEGRKGEGATFSFTLPLAERPAVASPSS